MGDFGTAAVLAGGKSRRMGFDKQLMEVGGRRVVLTVISNLQPRFKDVVVVSYRPELYEGLDVRVVEDTLPDNGLLGGIHAALSHAASRYAYVVACDMPVLHAAYVSHMRAELERTGAQACVTRNGDWIEPLNGFYEVGLVPAITRHLATGERSVYSFLRGQSVHYIEEDVARRYCPDFSMFLNLNTEEELRRYRELSARPPEVT